MTSTTANMIAKPKPTEGLALHIAFFMCLARDKCIVPGCTYKNVALIVLAVGATYTDWSPRVTHSTQIHLRLTVFFVFAYFVRLICVRIRHFAASQMSHLVMDTFNGKLGSDKLEK